MDRPWPYLLAHKGLTDMTSLEDINNYQTSTGGAFQAFPKLRSDNYFAWSASMELVLRALNQWKMVIVLHPKSSRDSPSVMSWGWTEGILRFYIFGEDLASAYVLRHQVSTVLEFQARGRQGFGGLDGEFEGQSMSISD